MPSALVAVARVRTTIETVDDVGADPQRAAASRAAPALRPQRRAGDRGAVAIAAIVLVQGAGVAESAPNPDGSPSSTNRDFIGQGVANVASGLFHGTPGRRIGHHDRRSNITAGARSRWASIFAGLWMLLILVAAVRASSALVLMPTLAAVLIYRRRHVR